MAVELVNRNGVRVGRLPNAPIPAPAPLVQVATPKVAPPPEPVRPIRPEASELGQIANSLSFFNENLRSLGSVYTRISNEENLQMGQQMAMQDMEKAREITKLGFKKASEQGLIDPGANPYMRLGLYETTGQIKGQEYREKLLAKKQEVASPFSSKTPEQVIAEVRQEALAELGDNFYAQQGFLKEANQAEQTFKNVTIQERARFTEIQTKEADALATTKIIGTLYSAQTPEETQASLTAFLDQWNKRAVYEPDVNKNMARDYSNAISNIIKKDPSKAREINDLVLDLQIKRRDGSLMSASEAFAGINDQIEGAIEQAEFREAQRAEQQVKILTNQAEIEVDAQIKNALSQNTSIISPEFQEFALQQVSQKYPSVDLATIAENIAKKTAQVNQVDEIKSAEYALNLAKTDPQGALEFVDTATGSTISFQTSQVLLEKIKKTNDNLNLLRSEVVGNYGRRFEDLVSANEAYGNLDTDEEKFEFLSDARGTFDNNVSDFLQTLPPNMPQAEVDIMLRKELPKIVKSTRDEVLEPLKAKTLSTQAFSESQLKNNRGTGANDQAIRVVKDSLFSKLNPWYSARNPFLFGAELKKEDEGQKLFTRLARAEQISNRLAVASQSPTKVSGFNQAKEQGELKELQGWLNNKGRTYLQTLGGFVRTGGVSNDFGFQRFSPEQVETYKTQYLDAKKRFGFNLMEIANNKTAEGIEFDPASLSIEDTLFFPSLEALNKAQDEYKQAVESGQPRDGQLGYIDVISQLYNLNSEEQINSFLLNQRLKANQVFGR